MTHRRTVMEWATDYVGDPESWQRRGEIIFELLRENGMDEGSMVLDIGCGNLSEGTPLIRFLRERHFVGMEPGGWMVEAALNAMPDLEHKVPRFLYGSDFDASETGERFTHIVSHSVLSHVAHWQLDQYLTNTRKVVDEGAVMLASFINDQYNSHHVEWTYPGVSTFRFPSVVAAGHYAGWLVELKHDYTDRVVAECPNDTHSWLRLVAVPSTTEMNERRLSEEALQDEERKQLAASEEKRVLDAEKVELQRMIDAGLTG